VAIDPNAHSWSAWEVTTPATATTTGVETRTCAYNPAHIETRSIPATGTGGFTPGGPPPSDLVITPPPDEVDIIDTETPLFAPISFVTFINGYPNNTFRGTNTINREEFINILFKLKNPDLPATVTFRQSFNDIAPGRWSHEAIEWAVTAGIIEVDGTGSFFPKGALTRGDVAVMLAKAEGWTEKAENIFSDIENHKYYEYILLAVNAGVFEGYPDGTFRADAPISRYELVTAMVRYLLGGEPTDEMWENIDVSFTDVRRDQWHFRYLALATQGYTALLPEKEPEA